MDGGFADYTTEELGFHVPMMLDVDSEELCVKGIVD